MVKQMKKAKGILSVVISVLLGSSLLAACGSSGASSSQPSVPASSAPVVSQETDAEIDEVQEITLNDAQKTVVLSEINEIIGKYASGEYPLNIFTQTEDALQGFYNVLPPDTNLPKTVVWEDLHETYAETGEGIISLTAYIQMENDYYMHFYLWDDKDFAEGVYAAEIYFADLLPERIATDIELKAGGRISYLTISRLALAADFEAAPIPHLPEGAEVSMNWQRVNQFIELGISAPDEKWSEYIFEVGEDNKVVHHPEFGYFSGEKDEFAFTDEQLTEIVTFCMEQAEWAEENAKFNDGARAS